MEASVFYQHCLPPGHRKNRYILSGSVIGSPQRLGWWRTLVLKLKPYRDIRPTDKNKKKPYSLTPYGFKTKQNIHNLCKAGKRYSYPGFCTIRLLLFIACSGMG
jgi:hypothetical protein